MSSAAQILANRENSHLSTGPRTSAGKENSSRNALASGLFTTADFVRPDEREEYESTRASLWSEISPAGVLEETFASAILTATWRLRRCGLVEAALAETSSADPMLADPAAGEQAGAARIQLSVDRARSKAHTQLRHSLAELRRLQTERAIRRELFARQPETPAADLTSYKKVVSASFQAQKLNRAESIQNRELASFCNPPRTAQTSPLQPAA